MLLMVHVVENKTIYQKVDTAMNTLGYDKTWQQSRTKSLKCPAVQEGTCSCKQVLYMYVLVNNND